MKAKTSEKPLAEKLFKAALAAQKNAHAPYSKFKIGAAVLADDGKIYSGCNVENASYGGTVCAERVAIFKAVSEGASMPLREICIVSSQKDPWPPCGFCRQVLAEFAAEKTIIYLANEKGIQRKLNFADIFPESFNPKFLK